MRKVFELRALELDEISLVDKGANTGAKVVLMKRDISKMIKEENGKFCVYSMDGKKLGEHDTREEAMAQLKAVEANKETKKGRIAEVLSDIKKFLGLADETDETELQAELEKAGKKISAARLEKLKSLYKTLQDIIMEQESSDDTNGEASKMDTSKLSKAEQDYIKELEAKAAHADAVAKKATEDAVAKAQADAKAEIEKAKKDAEEAKEEVAKERDARLNKEYEGKVSVFKRLAIKADDAKVFRAIDEKLPEELSKRMWEIVKGANEAMASAAIMTKQIGSGEGDNGSDDHVSKVETLMKAELAKNDKLSEGKAMAEVFAKNPGLYEAYKEATAVRV